MSNLQQEYPDCYTAVVWCELYLRESLPKLRAGKLLPGTVRDLIQETLREEISMNMPGRNQEALDQTSHHSFLIYLAGKLGAK